VSGPITGVGMNLGTSDLAASLGVTGQTSHPKVIEASEIVLTAATRKGIAVGCPAGTVEEGLQFMKRGFRALSCGNAETFLLRSVQQHLQALQR
jgi:2-keto-3-deoxy-L-rhamnonate aldolase RhmA